MSAAGRPAGATLGQGRRGRGVEVAPGGDSMLRF
jgi:hypothetical protein